jgi:putative tricarboxylic transport membrane protein
MSIIAIMIPVAITLGDPAAALILLAGVYYGAIFGGSTSSILLNAPGVAGTVATSFDGYPMARRAGGQGADHRRRREFRGRHDRRGPSDDLRARAVDGGAAVPLGRVFRADGRGPQRHRGLRRHGAGGQGVDDDDPGLILATVGEGALFNMPRFTLGLMDLQSGIPSSRWPWRCSRCPRRCFWS